jgi:hypothetical protein
MGFDLWHMLGVTPAQGVAMVAACVAGALLLGGILARRRTRGSRVLGIGLGDR